MPRPEVIALFGPTGVGKTDVALALADLLRARGEDPVAVGADALQVYAGLEVLTGAPTPAERDRLEHRLVGVVPVTEAFSAGAYAPRAHAEIDGLLAAGRRPIVVGGTGLYLRAALTELALRPPPAAGARERWAGAVAARGAPAVHSELARRAGWAAEGIDPNDRARIVRAHELLDADALRPRRGASRLWTAETRRSTLLAGLVMDRASLVARIDARVGLMVAAGAAAEVRAADAAGASRDRSRRGRLRRAPRRRRAGDADPHAALRQAPAHLDAQARRRPGARRHRPPGGRDRRADRRRVGGGGVHLDCRAVPAATVPFEKWQALGNDYVIVEAARLPFALTPARVARLCAAHTGIGSDGVLVLSRPAGDDAVAALRIFNPDGSEAELSGNGAREAILYLRRRGWTHEDAFTLETAAGPVRPQITGPTTCRVELGRAATASAGFPGGPPDGRGEIEVGGRRATFRHVAIGNPQCAIGLSDPADVDALDLPALGPEIERDPRFPQRTNVSWYAPLPPAGTRPGDRIRARIFERGVGETMSSGTGASGAAVAHVLDGGTSPVTVVLDGGELEVEIGEDLTVTLTGWAVPVYRGELAEDFVEALHATE